MRIHNLSLVSLLFSMQTLPHISWRDRHALPEPVAGGYSAAFGKTVVYAGGTNWSDGVKHWMNSTHLYDIENDRWTAGPPLPVPLAYGAQASLPDGIEIHGGVNSQRVFRDSWRFSAGSNTWTRSGATDFDTLLSGSDSIDGVLYVFGGCSDVADLTGCSSAVHAHSSTGTWRKVSEMPGGPVAQPATAAVAGRIFLFGGCSMRVPGQQVNHAEAYSLEISSMTWRRIRPLPKPNSGPSAVALNGRYILIAGGYNKSREEAAGRPADFGFSADAAFYDIEQDRYVPTGSLPVPLSGLELLKAGDTIFGLGGEDRMRGRTARVFAGTVAW